MAGKRRKPRCIVIAGPNGAGKTTFARDYYPQSLDSSTSSTSMS